MPAGMIYLGYEKITTTGSVVELNANVPASARAAVIQADGGDVHFRADGVNPAASVGTHILDGTKFEVFGNPRDLRLWVEGGECHVTYFGTEDVQT